MYLYIFEIRGILSTMAPRHPGADLPAAFQRLAGAATAVLASPGNPTPFPTGWFRFDVTVSSEGRHATATKWVQFVNASVDTLAVEGTAALAWAIRSGLRGSSRSGLRAQGPNHLLLVEFFFVFPHSVVHGVSVAGVHSVPMEISFPQKVVFLVKTKSFFSIF